MQSAVVLPERVLRPVPLPVVEGRVLHVLGRLVTHLLAPPPPLLLLQPDPPGVPQGGQPPLPPPLGPPRLDGEDPGQGLVLLTGGARSVSGESVSPHLVDAGQLRWREPPLRQVDDDLVGVVVDALDLGEVESVEVVPLGVVPHVQVTLELDCNPRVLAGVCSLHPPEHDPLQLQILAPYGLHLVVGVEAGLKLQVSDELDILVEGDVDDSVHVVEAGPVLIEVKRPRGHEPPVELEEDPVGHAAVLVLVPVDGQDPGEVVVLGGHLLTGLLAVEAGLEVYQSSVPASQVGNTGD